MPLPPATHALILAAGGSRRMGQPKALLPTRGLLPGQTLLDAHIAALTIHCQRCCVVLGSQSAAIRSTLSPEVEVIDNPDWEHTHLADSIALGLGAFLEEDRVLITPVDAAPAPAVVCLALLAAGAPAVPTHQGQPGHPVLVLAGPTRRALATHTLAQVLANAPRIEVDWADCCRNLNTPEAWEAWLQSLSVGR
jgi:molybdenum cofactor cytidylyltransferase